MTEVPEHLREKAEAARAKADDEMDQTLRMVDAGESLGKALAGLMPNEQLAATITDEMLALSLDNAADHLIPSLCETFKAVMTEVGLTQGPGFENLLGLLPAMTREAAKRLRERTEDVNVPDLSASDENGGA